MNEFSNQIPGTIIVRTITAVCSVFIDIHRFIGYRIRPYPFVIEYTGIKTRFPVFIHIEHLAGKTFVVQIKSRYGKSGKAGFCITGFLVDHRRTVVVIAGNRITPVFHGISVYLELSGTIGGMPIQETISVRSRSLFQ